jgi:hypothetical protein
MRTIRKLLLGQNPNRIDLLVGYWRPHSLGPDQTQDTVRSKHPLTVLVPRHQLDKQITAEQGQLYDFFAVSPAMNFPERGQKGCHPCLAEALSNGFFMLRPGVHCIPAFTSLLDEYRWIRRIRCLNADVQDLASATARCASYELAARLLSYAPSFAL